VLSISESLNSLQANITAELFDPSITRGKKSAFSVKRELRILSRLSHYVKDKQEAAKLVDVLLPFLRAKKRMDLG